MFYLIGHTTLFIYDYLVSDIVEDHDLCYTFVEPWLE